MAHAHHQQQASSVRLARLDGLRGLAACGVAFAYHTNGLYRAGSLPDGPLAAWLHMWGWLFVDLFFVLSGYIFAHVYLGRGDGRSGAPAFGQGAGDLADFAVARVARLYPLHLVMLLVTAALFWDRPENTVLAFGAHLLMLQAVVQPVAHTFDGPTWSLSVEAVCYVLFALGAASGPHRLRLVTGGAIALAVVMLLANSAPEGSYVRDNFPRGLLGFFVGQLLWHKRVRLARVPSWLLALLIPAALCLPVGAVSPILPVTLLAWPAALLLGLRLAWLERRPMLWLGDRSYAIYLIHFPLLELYVRAFGQLGGSLGEIVLGHAVFIGVTLLLSDLALRFIEYPARRAIRAGWTRRAPRPAIA